MSFLTIQKYHTPSRRKSLHSRHFLVWMLILIIPVVVIAGWLLLDYKHTATQAATGIPSLITYQGKVADSTGTAITNGNHNFLFQIYSTHTGGTPLWTESWTATTTAGAVSVINGTFSVALGTSTSLATIDFNQDNLYLQISFDADSNGSFEETFSPRKQLTSAPYAFNAGKLGGLTSGDFLSTSTATTTNLYVSTFGINNEYITDLTGDGLTISGGALTLGNSGVIASTYGNSGTIAQFTVDSYGRLIGATEIAIDASNILNGILGISYGGTGNAATPTYGQMLVGDGSGYVLTATSSLGIALSDTVGTLAVARGGTGLITTPSYGELLVGDGSGGYTLLATSSLAINNDWHIDTNFGGPVLTPSTTIATWFQAPLYVSSTVSIQGDVDFATTTIGTTDQYFEFSSLLGVVPIIKSYNGFGNIGFLNSGWFVSEDTTVNANPFIGFIDGGLSNTAVITYATSSHRLELGLNNSDPGSFFFDLNSSASTVYIGGNGNGHADTALVVTATTTDSAGFALKVYDDSETIPLFTVRNDGNVGIGTSTPWAKLSVDGQVAFQGENFATTTIGNRNTYFNFEKTTLAGIVDAPVIRGQSSVGGVGIGIADALYMTDFSAPNPIVTFVASTTLNSSSIVYEVSSDSLGFIDAGGGYKFANPSDITNLRIGELDLGGSFAPDLLLPTLYGQTVSSDIGALGLIGVNNGLLVIEDAAADANPTINFAGADFGDTANSATITFVTSTGAFALASNATTTSDTGFDITDGCYAINGVCITGGSGSSQWTTVGDDVFYSNAAGGGAGVLNDISPIFILGSADGSRFAGMVYSSSTDVLTFTQATSYQFDNGPLNITTTTATSTFAGNVQIASGKYLQVSDVIAYSPLTIHTDLVLSGDLAIGGLLNCNSANQALQTDGSGNVSCATITASGGASDGVWQYLVPNIVRIATTTDIVGIGTTTPYAKLSINSGSVATTTLALSPVSAQTANIIDIYNTSGRLSSVFTAGGSLGIGTTSPYAMLSVAGETVARNFTATSTSVASSFPLASTTQLSISNNLYVGSLTGPLQAVNGLVSATTSIGVVYGGTGLTSAPAYGQLLVGNASNGYTLTATSSLGIAISDTTGTLTAARGGTGQSSYTTGDLLYASAATTLSKLAGVATGNALISGGVGTAPSWGKIGLTTHISGVLPIANGGTNNSSAYTSGSVIISNGTSLTQDNSGLFFDATNDRLGIGTTTPASPLTVYSSSASLTNDAIGYFKNTADHANLFIDAGASKEPNIVFAENYSNLWSVGTDATTDRLRVRASNFGTEVLTILTDGKIGIGETTPASLFTVGSGDVFQIGTDGDIDKIKNVAYSWPSSQGSASTVLSNDGSGNLSWASVAGSSGGWTDDGSFVRLTTATDNIGAGGATSTHAKLTVSDASSQDTVLNIRSNATSQRAARIEFNNSSSSLPTTSKGNWYLENPWSDSAGYMNLGYGGFIGVDAMTWGVGRESCPTGLSGIGCGFARVGIGTTTPNALLNIVREDSYPDTNALLRLGSDSATGEPDIMFSQQGTDRAQIKYEDTADDLQVVSGYGDISLRTGTSGPGVFAVERLSIDNTGLTVFNETGVSTADFRMESDTDIDMFFLDASANRIGISTSTPFKTFSIDGTIAINPAALTTNIGASTYSLCLAAGGEVTKNSDAETCIASSIRYKENIEPLQLGLDQLLELQAVTFAYKNSPDTQHIGLIAEEVAAVDPMLASYDESGLPSGIRWSHVTTLLVQSVQEQQSQITSLKNQLDALSLSVMTATTTVPFTVSEAATFYGTITVLGEGLFKSKVVFENDVTINGHLELGKDTSGSAVIKEGEDEIKITFEKPYEQAPRVVITPQGPLEGRTYWIEDKTETGFTIALDDVVSDDLTFDWIALVNTDPVEDVAPSNEPDTVPESNQNVDNQNTDGGDSENQVPVDQSTNVEPTNNTTEVGQNTE